MKDIVYARCHFTDDYVKIISYMGMGNYHVEYPDGEMQLAHESTLDYDGGINARLYIKSDRKNRL